MNNKNRMKRPGRILGVGNIWKLQVREEHFIDKISRNPVSVKRGYAALSKEDLPKGVTDTRGK